MTDITKRLGYGGSVEIDGIQSLITGGSFDESHAISYIEYLDIKPVNQSRSRAKHADGVSSYSGSVSIDVSEKSIPLFDITRLLERRFEFNVGINDGENGFEMTDCMVSSISLSGGVGGLIAATIGFVALTAKQSASVANQYVLNYDTFPDNQPAAYWWSGADDVRDWSFNYTQDVAPVYSNEDTTDPRYLRAGMISYSLQVTTYSKLDHDAVEIITSSFTLKGDTTGRSYTFNGPSDLGMYGHSFETAASAATGSDDIIIT